MYPFLSGPANPLPKRVHLGHPDCQCTAASQRKLFLRCHQCRCHHFCNGTANSGRYRFIVRAKNYSGRKTIFFSATETIVGSRTVLTSRTIGAAKTVVVRRTIVAGKTLRTGKIFATDITLPNYENHVSRQLKLLPSG